MKHDVRVDAKGLACPMPIVRTKKAMKDLEPGKVVEIQATDKGSTADLKAWAKKAGHEYLGTIEDGDTLKHYVRAASLKQEEQAFPHTVKNEELQTLIKNNEAITILDVREKDEFDNEHIPEAISMPFGELEERMNELQKQTPIYVICRTGNRSDMAAQKLAAHGYNQVFNVLPGMNQWTRRRGNIK
ncbi:hypothetical protein AB990_00570 [Alkalihalobacillus pseudalcaliphilus]|nr:hypothetical protein AB990_00570 [Alkalihalobacillus pseudalcaliphilus]